MLRGRRVFMGSLWRYARRSGEFLPALSGIATHFVRGGVDVATVSLGLNRLGQRSRLKPVRPSVAKQWQDLRVDLGLAEETS